MPSLFIFYINKHIIQPSYDHRFIIEIIGEAIKFRVWELLLPSQQKINIIVKMKDLLKEFSKAFHKLCHFLSSIFIKDKSASGINFQPTIRQKICNVKIFFTISQLLIVKLSPLNWTYFDYKLNIIIIISLWLLLKI